MKKTQSQYAAQIIKLGLLCVAVFVNLAVFGVNTDTLEKRVYKIGFPQVPGFMYRDVDGKVTGFPIELFIAMADAEGIQCEYIEDSWSNLLEKLKAGEIDALPGTQVTEERKVYLDFMEESSYEMWSELLIDKRVNLGNLHSLAGKKIGVVDGDNNGIAFERYIEKFQIKYTPVSFATHYEAVIALKNKEIFALAAPPISIMTTHFKGLKSSGLYFNATNSNVSFPKNKNAELKVVLDRRLRIMKSDVNSIYYELYDKYGPANIKSSYDMPTWLLMAMVTLLATFVLIVVFVIVLRTQVRKKTEELKNREHYLTERAVYLGKTMEMGDMGTWVYDIKTREFKWSEELFKMLDLPIKDAMSADVLLSLIENGKAKNVQNTIREAIKSGDNFDLEFSLKETQGRVKHCRQIGVMVADNKGVPVRYLGIMQNITEQYKYESELIQAKEKAVESERLKSAFLANMSHEIRTPLNAIVGFTELLVEQKQTQKDKDRFKAIILDQNKQLLNLINDIIDVAKIESGSLEVFIENNVLIYEVVRDVFDGLQQQCPNEIKFSLSHWENDLQCAVNVDRNRVKQILNNFVINAFKYTESGEVVLGYRVNADCEVEIFVKDTGIGISEETQQIIFNRFHQLDSMAQGTGLGLAISKSLADLMGGEISLSSKVNQGSEFVFTIIASE